MNFQNDNLDAFIDQSNHSIAVTNEPTQPGQRGRTQKHDKQLATWISREQGTISKSTHGWCWRKSRWCSRKPRTARLRESRLEDQTLPQPLAPEFSGWGRCNSRARVRLDLSLSRSPLLRNAKENYLFKLCNSSNSYPYLRLTAHNSLIIVWEITNIHVTCSFRFEHNF